MSAPRVRVVVVDYDGGDLTLRCLERLVASEHPADALDVVLVDNGSRRPVVEQVRRDFPTVRIIESAVNRGFAGGCNLGVGDLTGVDAVALVNNDATVPPDWLSPLLDALAADAGVGAACPKILLAKRYREVTVTTPTERPGRGDRRDLGVRITGLRVNGRDAWRDLRFPAGTWGPERDRDGVELQWTAAAARLLLPALEAKDCAELRLDALRPATVTVASGAERATFDVGPTPAWHPVPAAGAPFDVVNNVGTELVADGYAADRGWLERDTGQYERTEDVFAWCGAAVVLRADYLRDIGGFDERLFLYSEDVELSWRGLGRGWRHRYVPGTVVRHVHSATSVGTPKIAALKERNRLLVLLRHGSSRHIVRAIIRYVLVTASYARRDVVAPLAAGTEVRTAPTRTRLRALGGFFRLAPAMVISRRSDALGRSRPLRSRPTGPGNRRR
jgi:GT2 family glycosyltransferase